MSLSRWGGLLAILAAVLLVAGFLVVSDTPDGDADDEEWVEATEDDAGMALTRAYLFTLGGFAIAGFFAFGIRPRLPEADPRDRALAHLGMSGAVLGATFITVGGLMGAASGAANMFQDVPVDAGVARTLDNLGFGFVIVAGALSLGLVMLIVAIQALRTEAFPQWVGWLSILGVIAMAASVVFLPFIYLAVWLVAMGVYLLMRGAEDRAYERTPARA